MKLKEIIMGWLGFKKVEIKHRQEWSEKDIATLKFYVNNNMDDELIAERLGRTKRAVQQMRYREGIF